MRINKGPINIRTESLLLSSSLATIDIIVSPAVIYTQLQVMYIQAQMSLQGKLLLNNMERKGTTQSATTIISSFILRFSFPQKYTGASQVPSPVAHRFANCWTSGYPGIFWTILLINRVLYERIMYIQIFMIRTFHPPNCSSNFFPLHRREFLYNDYEQRRHFPR